MRIMHKEERDVLRASIRAIFSTAVSSDYSSLLLEYKDEDDDDADTIMDDIIEDVMLASSWEESGYYNDDDIRLAIGRALMSRLGIYY